LHGIFTPTWTNVFLNHYGLDGPGFKSRSGEEIFLISKMFRVAVGLTQPPSKCVLGFFPGVKGPAASI
jgi:hypothetical protein